MLVTLSAVFLETFPLENKLRSNFSHTHKPGAYVCDSDSV